MEGVELERNVKIFAAIWTAAMETIAKDEKSPNKLNLRLTDNEVQFIGLANHGLGISSRIGTELENIHPSLLYVLLQQLRFSEEKLVASLPPPKEADLILLYNKYPDFDMLVTLGNIVLLMSDEEHQRFENALYSVLLEFFKQKDIRSDPSSLNQNDDFTVGRKCFSYLRILYNSGLLRPHDLTNVSNSLDLAKCSKYQRHITEYKKRRSLVIAKREPTKLQMALGKAMEEGYVSLDNIKMVICGPPCVGKTAFKALLLNNPAPLKHNSTPITARPVKAIERIAAGMKIWEEIREEDLLKMLFETIRDTEIVYPSILTEESYVNVDLDPQIKFSALRSHVRDILSSPSALQSASSDTSKVEGVMMNVIRALYPSLAIPQPISNTSLEPAIISQPVSMDLPPVPLSLSPIERFLLQSAIKLQHASMDPSAIPASVDPSPIPASVDPSPIPTSMDPSPIPASVDPSPIPASLDPSPIPASLDPSAIPASVDPSAIPASVDPSPIPTSLDPSPIPASVDPSPIPASVDSSAIPASMNPPPIPASLDPSLIPQPENILQPTAVAPFDVATPQGIDYVSKKIIEHLSSPKGRDRSQKLHEATWIHLLDSGGQPQFTDLLRMFVRGNSIYILVIKVTESLHDKPTFVYSIDGKPLNAPREITMTNLQIIENFVHSVAATSRDSLGDKSQPAIAIVATHCDQQSWFRSLLGWEETLMKKNEKLLSCLTEFLDLFVFYNCDSHELIFPVNNLCEWNREKISADIHHRLLSTRSDISFSVKIPVRWYVFDLNMKEEASKESHGMISLQSCYAIGNKIGMDNTEVDQCLIYLDSMRLCIYYPNLLPHVVFTNPHFLIDSLSNIVQVSFVDDLQQILPEGICLSDDVILSLKRDGVFDELLLNTLELTFIPHLFSKSDLLLLLRHFLVISTIEAPHISPNRYFIPILLPAERLTKEQKTVFSQKIDPLLITFKGSIVLQVS